jgi:hypothetical protein
VLFYSPFPLSESKLRKLVPIVIKLLEWQAVHSSGKNRNRVPSFTFLRVDRRVDPIEYFCIIFKHIKAPGKLHSPLLSLMIEKLGWLQTFSALW